MRVLVRDWDMYTNDPPLDPRASRMRTIDATAQLAFLSTCIYISSAFPPSSLQAQTYYRLAKDQRQRPFNDVPLRHRQ